MPVAGRIARCLAASTNPLRLVTRIEDVRWLTGFTGGTAQVVLDADSAGAVLIVDGRYAERAEAELAVHGVEARIVVPSTGQDIDDLVVDVSAGRPVALDHRHVSAARARDLSQRLTLVDERGTMDALRRVKDDDEVALMERCAAVADSALADLLADGLVGRTERQVRNRLDALMAEHGADRPGFDTIVATGPNGARPHHEPGDTGIESGHMVIIDFGAEIDGYRSDMTRTVRVGVPSAGLQTMFGVVAEAQRAGVAAVRAGVVGSEVDAAVRAVYAREGLEHEYLHGTGHGIGLFIHEDPILSPRCEAVLAAGEVVTVEPGLYRKGVGGVRIEDQVVVTGTGCRVLTLTPKELSCPRSPRTI